jgi:hypothetical protein
MRIACLGMLFGMAWVGLSCRHLSGPSDRKGSPLLVCHSPRVANLPECGQGGEYHLGGEYGEALRLAVREFERELLEDLARGNPEDPVARCLARIDSHDLAVGILDEDIEVHFIPTGRCLPPDTPWADGGAFFRFRRGGHSVQRVLPE